MHVVSTGANMNSVVPVGYKQTEVGLIPEDWNYCKLSELIEFPVQNGVFNEPARKGRGCKLINVSDLYASTPIDISSLELFDASNSEKLRFGIQHGDVFFTRSSITPDGIAHCNVYDETLKEDIVFDCHLIRVRANKKKINPFFLFRFCTIAQTRKYLVANAKTTTMTTIGQGVIAGLPVLLPPLPEQEAIAEALSDTDALIESLEQLITKKLHLKQGAMQELLTGKKRLPGFSGEWEVKRFDEIVRLRKERIDPRRSGIQEFCIELEHIEQGTGCLAGYTETGENSSLKSVFHKDDVLFGKLRAYLRKYWLANSTGVCSTEIWVLMAIRSLLIPRFLFQLVKVDSFVEVASTAYGTHMPRSDWNVVKNYEVPLPPIAEQEIIATILSDMDAEITSLETKLAKTRQLKQGMMRELLTGRIRLR